MESHKDQTLARLLKRVCDLQPLYSSDNTPEMQERGTLIRHDLVNELEARSDELSTALGQFGADIGFGASDGVGRKTQAPWIRFYSESMSPTPREGYYMVIHFSADGSGVFFTIGCGSTIWANGMFYRLPDEELLERTKLARMTILRDYDTLEPFTDQIELGAKAPLTKSFEKATAIAKRIDYSDLDTVDLGEILVQLSGRLQSVYRGQQVGVDLSPADQSELDVQALIKPTKTKPTGSQGYGLGGDERKAVELQAMDLAARWFEERDYIVVDQSASKPYDLEASKDGLSLKVEVKGTTSMQPNAVLMTRNEVDLHRSEKGSTALVIVSGIELTKGKAPTAKGGIIETMIGWDIDEWELTATTFRVERSSDNNNNNKP